MVRIRWLDGEYDDLVEWVPSPRLVVPWTEVEEFARDEKSKLALDALQPSPPEEGVTLAVQAIYYAVESGVDFRVYSGTPISATVERFDEIRSSLAVPADQLLGSPGAFVDRHGVLHVGQIASMVLARAICDADTAAVLKRVADDTARARRATITGVWVPGAELDPYCIDRTIAAKRLREYEAAEEVIRGWYGVATTTAFDEQENLRAEVMRLSALIEDVARWLRHRGHPVKAGLLLRDLNPEKTAPHR